MNIQMQTLQFCDPFNVFNMPTLQHCLKQQTVWDLVATTNAIDEDEDEF